MRMLTLAAAGCLWNGRVEPGLTGQEYVTKGGGPLVPQNVDDPCGPQSL